jgi:hypothetical protein
MLCQCWLAPLKVWEQFDQIRDRWKFSRHNWNRYFGHEMSVAQYYPWKNLVLDNLAMYANMHFPDITQQPRSIEQVKAKFSNDEYLPRMEQRYPAEHWVGSSGRFYLTLTKKLGFWRHSTDRRRGWFKWSTIRNVRDLYNKYRCDEDTRNTNH